MNGLSKGEAALALEKANGDAEGALSWALLEMDVSTARTAPTALSPVPCAIAPLTLSSSALSCVLCFCSPALDTSVGCSALERAGRRVPL